MAPVRRRQPDSTGARHSSAVHSSRDEQQHDAIAVHTACDKELTKTLLARAAIAVPFGQVVESEDAAVRAFEEIGAPVAVKPLDGNQGKCVSVGISTRDNVVEAFQAAAKFSKRGIVEEMFHGRDYRLLVIDGKLIAGSERIPAQVQGDGSHNIGELIEIANQDPMRGDGHAKRSARSESIRFY